MGKNREKALKAELSHHFTGQAQRIVVLSKLILGMLQMSSVNYSKLSLVLNPLVKVSSNFKRIQRFMRYHSFCQRQFVQWVWHQYDFGDKCLDLSMDRTNWKFGRFNINILTVGIVWKGTAIPLIWMMLDKRGQSNQEERIYLILRLLSYLSEQQASRIGYLLLDREFAAKDWLAYLKSKGIHFLIRIRKDAKVRKLGKSKEVKAYTLFQNQSFQAKYKQRIIFGHRLYVGGQQVSNTDGKEEYLILISDVKLRKATQKYALRWGIEVFFGACKTRGFNFEDTHLNKMERVNTLMFVLAIAFIWAVKIGDFLIENDHQIPIKKLKNRTAKLYSIFRVGLDEIKHKLLNHLEFDSLIYLLSCT